MTDKGGQPKGGKVPFGSVLIMFLLKIIGGLSSLFHIKGKWSCGSMTDEEQKLFSTMMDGMKQDMAKKDR